MATTEMAQRLDQISDRAVRYRLDRLQREQIIQVTAIINTTRLGYPLMGDVLVEVVPWKLHEGVAHLAKDDRVCYIAASPDQTQISFQVNGRDRADLMRIVGEVLENMDGVIAVRIAPLSRLFRDVSDWVTPVEESTA